MVYHKYVENVCIEDINLNEQQKKNNYKTNNKNQTLKVESELRGDDEEAKQKHTLLRFWFCTIRVKCSSHTKPWLTKKTLINRWLDCARARNLSETWETNEKIYRPVLSVCNIIFVAAAGRA